MHGGGIGALAQAHSIAVAEGEPPPRTKRLGVEEGSVGGPEVREPPLADVPALLRDRGIEPEPPAPEQMTRLNTPGVYLFMMRSTKG